MTLSPRAPLVASVLAFPLMLGVAAGATFVGGLLGVHPLWNEPALTLPEAAALNDRGTVLRLVQAGTSLETPARVRAGIITGADIVATPLQASVATRTPTTMQFLLAQGAQMSEQDRLAVTCLAMRTEADEIIEYLRRTIGADQIDIIDCADVVTPW